MPTPDTVIAFRALTKLDMNQCGFAIFASEMISADETPDAVTGVLGYFAPMTKLYPSAKLDAFRAKLEKKLKTSVDRDSKSFVYSVLSYDHIYAIGHAIKSAKEAGEKVIDGEVLMNHLRNVDFAGASGRISLQPGTNDRAHLLAFMDRLEANPTETLGNFSQPDPRGRMIEVKILSRHAVLFFKDPFADLVKILDIRNVEAL